MAIFLIPSLGVKVGKTIELAGDKIDEIKILNALKSSLGINLELPQLSL
ncbi:hypothetical protein [Formosa sp. 4Alg 33]